MTHQNNQTFAEEILEKDVKEIREMIRVLINNAMPVKNQGIHKLTRRMHNESEGICE